MSSNYSPAPSDCGSAEARSSCTCSNRSQHAAGECLRIIASKYGHMDPIALTPQPSPTRRRPEESILMDDLRRAREEMRGLREELEGLREERDMWKIRNHGVPSECYDVIKQHCLQSGKCMHQGRPHLQKLTFSFCRPESQNFAASGCPRCSETT
jgi:hypothetical protein